MFTVTDDYVFTRPVSVLVPANGGHEKQTFSATFRMIPVEEQDAYDLGTTEGSTGLLRAIVVELGDLAGRDGAPLPYSDKVRDDLLRWQIIRVALTTAYFDAVKKAIEGN